MGPYQTKARTTIHQRASSALSYGVMDIGYFTQHLMAETNISWSFYKHHEKRVCTDLIYSEAHFNNVE